LANMNGCWKAVSQAILSRGRNMDIRKMSLEELLSLRNQISSRIKFLRAQKQAGRIRNREKVANRLKGKGRKGDAITFRLGVQRYRGTVTNRKGSHVVVDYLDTFARTRKIANVPYYKLIEIL
jgi:ribosomal protein L29